jgi:hypothetical protein
MDGNRPYVLSSERDWLLKRLAAARKRGEKLPSELPIAEKSSLRKSSFGSFFMPYASGVALLERRAAVRRILKALTYIAAGLYLLVDAIFMTIAKPIAKWIDKHVPLTRLRDWIRALPPYPSLALFSVPVIVLEPIKPIAAYLAATGQFLSGAVTFIFGELLKLVLVERLFSLTREKLMRVPAFARLYQWYSQAIAWLKATDAWRTLESVARSARGYLRVTGMRAAQWIERRRNGHARRHLK